MRKKIEIKAGDTSGYLTAISEAPRSGPKNIRMINVVCVCGAKKTIRLEHFTTKRTRSCGCMMGELMKSTRNSHRKMGSRIYRVWSNMLNRCRNKNYKYYYRYGGRGITVCDRWYDFRLFYADMGDPPKGMELDRTDNDKGYYLENCRWVSHKVNVLNTKKVNIITVDDVVYESGNVASKALGIDRRTIERRCYNKNFPNYSLRKKYEVLTNA